MRKRCAWLVLAASLSFGIVGCSSSVDEDPKPTSANIDNKDPRAATAPPEPGFAPGMRGGPGMQRKGGK